MGRSGAEQREVRNKGLVGRQKGGLGAQGQGAMRAGRQGAQGTGAGGLTGMGPWEENMRIQRSRV